MFSTNCEIVFGFRRYNSIQLAVIDSQEILSRVLSTLREPILELDPLMIKTQRICWKKLDP